MHEIVEDFRQRVSDNHEVEELWSAVLARPTSSVRERAAGANVLALLAWGTDGDVRDLRRIVRGLGGRGTAETQERILASVDTGHRRPLTTRLIRRLGELAWGDPPPAEPDRHGDATELRTVCGEAAVRLLMVPDGADPVTPDIGSVDDLIQVFHRGDLPLWRRLVADTAHDPWSGIGSRNLRLLDGERDGPRARALVGTIELCRRFTEEDERRAVADHIRRCLAATGLTQREFATLLGTSSSRLSTYVTGTVTPSATMLLRINRVAKRARLTADDDQTI